MEKFNFNENGFKIINGYNHARELLPDDFDYTIRGIIFFNEKLIYLRINDFNNFYCEDFLKLKKIENKFWINFNLCIDYLNNNYFDFKIYNSNSINNLPVELKNYVLMV